MGTMLSINYLLTILLEPFPAFLQLFSFAYELLAGFYGEIITSGKRPSL